MEDYLCKCNKCEHILIDKNPQTGAKKHTLTGNEQELALLLDPEISNERIFFWGCPYCLTDDYLVDL